MTLLKCRYVWLCSCVVSSLTTTGGSAGIISTTGDINIIAPPPSVVEGNLESNTKIFLFPEFTDAAIPHDIIVDISVPGSYENPALVTPDTLPPGTPFSCYYLHFDPVAHQLVTGRTGSVTFDRNILGLIVLSQAPHTFAKSDPFLDLPGTAYPTTDTLRGLELAPAPKDKVTLSADRRTLTINRLGADLNTDQIRVITDPDDVTGIQEDTHAQGLLRLGPVYPNPFNPQTTIPYELLEPGRVLLAIFDTAGRRVRVLVDRHETQGPHWVAWNGTDDRGTSVASGVYFVRLEFGGQTTTRKIVLAK